MSDALACLRASPGLMVRQPLARSGSPLALCDYHAVAAPFKVRYITSPLSGRGAAGRHITKAAFMAALAAVLDQAAAEEPLHAFGAALDAAFQAFGSDSSYAAAMARTAVTHQQRAHTAALRAQLRQAAHQAVSACDARLGQFTCAATSACGTGDCQFAAPDMQALRSPAAPGRAPRPDNHLGTGTGFDPLSALDALEELRPFTVAVQVRDADGCAVSDRAVTAA